MANKLKALKNATTHAVPRWVANNECHSVAFKYPMGAMKYVLKRETFDTGDIDVSLDMRFVRENDQKVFVRKYTHADIPWGVDSSAAEIRKWFEHPKFVIPLSQECVLILEDPSTYLSRTQKCLISVVLNEEVSQKSEEARAIEDRLTNEIESLKRAHREEIMEIQGWP